MRSKGIVWRAAPNEFLDERGPSSMLLTNKVCGKLRVPSRHLRRKGAGLLSGAEDQSRLHAPSVLMGSAPAYFLRKRGSIN
jgi:hypothetical protein